jgi:hypothetical protein
MMNRNVGLDDVGGPVTLDECPPGLFLWDGHLGLKTEYAEVVDTADGRRVRVDAYVVESGEFFWGGTKSLKQRAGLIVQPVLIIL